LNYIMLSRLFSCAAAVLMLIAHARASDWYARAEAGVAWTSGIRPYRAQKNINVNQTRTVVSPSLRVGFSGIRPVALEGGVASYHNIHGRGFSTSGLIFSDDYIGQDLAVSYPLAESIVETSLTAKYRAEIGTRVHLDVGPSISWFSSRSEIADRVFRSSDVRLGGVAALGFALTQRWTVDVTYRYAAPPNHKLHVLGVGGSYRF